MKTGKVQYNGHEFLDIELVPVNQGSSRFFVGIVPVDYFLNIYTVKPVKYDSEKEAAVAATFEGDQEYFEYRVSTKLKRADSDDFERPENKKRIAEIAEFLNTKEYPLFPNTIIVTCNLINDEINIPIDTTMEKLASENIVDLPYLREDSTNSDTVHLYIPNKPNSVLVIDGQHRLRGLEQASDEIRNNYQILVSFMLGFPRAVVAEFFYTINYNQKPVSRSILYDLMGTFSYELNEITFMHEVVRVLNEVERSPFYRRIKMLGVVERSATPAIRSRMTISQAFLIDYLVNTISKDAMQSNTYPPIFLYYYQDKNKHSYIIKFLLNYFQAIRKTRNNDWENPQVSIICNSIGIGALIRVMHFIFLKMFIVDFAKDPRKIEGVGMTQLEEKLSGIEHVNFSKEKWAGVSSGGALNNLMKEIVSSIKYLEAPEYNKFIDNYKVAYVGPFKEWLHSAIKNDK